MFHDRPRDDEVKTTLTLSRKDLSAARRLLRLLSADEPPAPQILELDPPIGPAEHVDRATLVARARAEFHNRRRRVAVFGQSMFGEAAWDMLLALYILDMSGQRQTVGGLMQFAGTPTTTAKRWLDFLSARDLVQREPHPTDGRTFFVSLTPKARERLDVYLSGTVQTAV